MDTPHRHDPVTESRLELGDREALDRMLSLAYDELRRMAHRELQHERRGHTLSTTDLVHEAYGKLLNEHAVDRDERAYFFAAASQAMRRVLIDYARRRQALKRGGGWHPVALDDVEVAADDSSESLLSLDEALARLGALDDRLARVVECRYFGGLTEDETADALGVTARTVRRDWVKAKGWLYRELHDESRDGAP